MQQTRVSFKHRLEYAFFAGLISLLKHSPRWALRLEKDFLIFFLKKGSPRHSRLVSNNLALAFPDAGPSSRAGLKKSIYDHFGRVFMEIVRTFSRGDIHAILARTRVNRIDILARVLEKNRGAIVFSAHFGNWEWIPLILRDRLKKDIHIVARPMDNSRIEAKVREFRETMGSHVMYKKGSLRTILKRLGDNEIVCLLIDQNTVEREGVFVDFFGRKATAVTTVSQLYLKKGIPLVPAFLHYQEEEIVLDILPEIDYAAAGDDSAALASLTQQLARVIEEQVRKYPEQWFWFHDRWKTRPQGEAK
jgi:KDO2-lipid IV(A) lauroyltransferase